MLFVSENITRNNGKRWKSTLSIVCDVLNDSNEWDEIHAILTSYT